MGIPQFFSKSIASEANGPQQKEGSCDFRCLVPKTRVNNQPQWQCNCKWEIPVIENLTNKFHYSASFPKDHTQRMWHCTTTVLNKLILSSHPSFPVPHETLIFLCPFLYWKDMKERLARWRMNINKKSGKIKIVTLYWTTPPLYPGRLRKSGWESREELPWK